jgi:ABC-type branched-subunit amino acid transport system ATPase component
MLEIKNLTKQFGGIKAVQDVSFDVADGSITALVGPNGAGKTTIFHLVSGVYRADSGSIQFEDQDLFSLPTWRRARLGISRTFQLSRLFKNLSIEDNLLLAIREDDDQLWKMFFRGTGGDEGEKRRIHEMMDFVGLNKDPQTIVTDLSYGQQKLFDLARALLNSHCFLMLDEPVAGVNPVLRNRFKDLLKQLKSKGETILLIEHDMDFVRAVADNVIVMDQGRVLAQGNPEAVLKNENVLEAYLGTL